MAKRGYKLQEFVAHSGSVNCLEIGKKTSRLFVTGGDDQIVNVWSIGKPTSLVSLCGHATPVESVTINSAEVLVLAGATSGAIKLWDLEETKMVRTLPGHRSYCSAVEFHPFGEFFASGSMDTNLKIWDIRKKGCIHTYKGHTRGISNIKFTPDGRWVVSGGLDNVVKIWDLTAGKLLHDFKSHEGHIRSIDFHPLEFLLATGSADRTVKLWDLETFELIGSTKPEATGVRSIAFHPDGRTLFCGLDDSLKVVSWEPVVCHDAVDMGWSTLGDLSVHDGKLLGCSYYHNSVAVWAADISLIKPYRTGIVPDEISNPEEKHELQEGHLVKQGSLRTASPEEKHELQEGHLVKQGSYRRTTSSLRCPSPDYDNKEIKNIYVDTAGGKPVNLKMVGSHTSPTVVTPSNSSEIRSVPSQNKVSTIVTPSDSDEIESVPSQKKVSTILTPSLSNEIRSVPSQKKVSTIVTPSDSHEIRSVPLQKVIPSESNEIKSVPSQKKVSTVVTPSDSSEIRSVPSRKKVSRVVTSSNSSETRSVPSRKKVSTVGVQAKATGRTKARSFIVPALVLRDSPDSNNSINSRRESITSARASNVVSQNPSYARRHSPVIIDRERLLVPDVSESMSNERYATVVDNCNDRLAAENNARETSEEKQLNVEVVAPKLERILSPSTPSSQENSNGVVNSSAETNSVKFVNGVAVVRGRTRSLVERFEKKEKPNGDDAQSPEATSPVKAVPEISKAVPIVREEMEIGGISRDETTTIGISRNEKRTIGINRNETRTVGINRNETTAVGISRDETTTTGINRNETRTIGINRNEMRTVGINRNETTIGINRNETTAVGISRDETTTIGINRNETRTIGINRNEMRTVGINRNETTIGINRNETTAVGISRDETTTIGINRNETRTIGINRNETRTVGINRNQTTTVGINRNETTAVGINRDEATTIHACSPNDRASERTEEDHRSPMNEAHSTSSGDGNLLEDLMRNHDVFLSILRSRLTKLQVVRHFWVRNDIKGAVEAVRKLPDHSIQAELIGLLMEKMDVLTLDLFSCLLPVLLGLLGSKMERHANISLEMLLKLVAVFGPVVRSTISAAPTVGVDLHKEQRIQCCNQCFIQLQKIQRVLPVLIRRGGLLAKSAMELNMVLQD